MKQSELITEARRHYPPSDVKRLAEAAEFAAAAHSGQKRLSGEPYITHPLEVAAILIGWQMDIDSAIAGVLHDTLEDTEVELAQIEEKFGRDIAFLVDGVSKVGQARSGMRNLSSYLPRTSSNLAKLLIATASDIRILLIKLADRLHNLRTLEYLPPERQQKVASETLQVFAPLADRLGFGRAQTELESLAFAYLEPDEYHRLEKLLKKRLGSSHKHFEKIRRELSKQLKKDDISFQLDGRVKSIYSLHKKLIKVESIDDVYDLLALRVIVESKEDCYRVLGIIHALYQPVLTKIKDYISVPKPNGYQSLHTTVLTPHGQTVEFQIRTDEMHKFAERGLAASFHYNEQKSTKDYISRRINALPRNLNWINELQERVKSYIEQGEEMDTDLSIDLFRDRIFVFTPKGDILDLPEGASALDFAFAVHSDVGSHAQGAKINNKMAKLTSPLANGDIVEILTAKNVHPTEGWLNNVTTEKARQKVRSYLNKQA